MDKKRLREGKEKLKEIEQKTLILFHFRRFSSIRLSSLILAFTTFPSKEKRREERCKSLR